MCSGSMASRRPGKRRLSDALANGSRASGDAIPVTCSRAGALRDIHDTRGHHLSRIRDLLEARKVVDVDDNPAVGTLNHIDSVDVQAEHGANAKRKFAQLIREPHQLALLIAAAEK